MKKITIALFIVPVIVIADILFWAPWMGQDGGEDVIRKVQQQEDVKAELDQLSAQYSYHADTGKGCDGLSSQWAPFGRTVRYCEYGSWYITFWGQRL